MENMFGYYRKHRQALDVSQHELLRGGKNTASTTVLHDSLGLAKLPVLYDI
jgi:hypothetical protein